MGKTVLKGSLRGVSFELNSLLSPFSWSPAAGQCDVVELFALLLSRSVVSKREIIDGVLPSSRPFRQKRDKLLFRKLHEIHP